MANSNANTTQRLTTNGSLTPVAGNVVRMPLGVYGATWFAKIWVSAWNVTDSIGAVWEVTSGFRTKGSGVATKGTDATALLGDPMVIASADSGMTTCEISVDADPSTDSINVSVKGLSAKTINWVAKIETVEIG